MVNAEGWETVVYLNFFQFFFTITEGCLINCKISSLSYSPTAVHIILRFLSYILSDVIIVMS